MFFDHIINLNSWLKNNFLLLIYRILKMPRKVLYNSEDEESIDDEQPIKKQDIIKTPKTEQPVPITEQVDPITEQRAPELKTKPDIICVHCNKQFSRQTILNKHLKEFRCKGLIEKQLYKEQEISKKQIELNALEEKMFIQIKKKQARMEKKIMKELGKEELKEQKIMDDDRKAFEKFKMEKQIKPKKEVKQVEKEIIQPIPLL